MSKNEPTDAQSEATDEIRSLFGEIYAAWADNDADAFMASYRDDATVVMRPFADERGWGRLAPGAGACPDAAAAWCGRREVRASLNW
ncbi:hypothetical protein ACSVHC_05185 [Arthrobacter sp. KNU-44]|uniref:hypothetical protein n=1 Tax=Arthrobacter sp. KNU-44 TaxID=3450744 RepID=UPI003F42443C